MHVHPRGFLCVLVQAWTCKYIRTCTCEYPKPCTGMCLCVHARRCMFMKAHACTRTCMDMCRQARPCICMCVHARALHTGMVHQTRAPQLCTRDRTPAWRLQACFFVQTRAGDRSRSRRHHPPLTHALHRFGTSSIRRPPAAEGPRPVQAPRCSIEGGNRLEGYPYPYTPMSALCLI